MSLIGSILSLIDSSFEILLEQIQFITKKDLYLPWLPFSSRFSPASVNVCPYFKSFSFVFIKTSHRVRTHLAQVPFTLDVFFCSRSLFVDYFSIKRLVLEILFCSLFLSLSLIFTLCVCLYLSLLRAWRYIRMRDITQFFLFRKIFICSVLISFLLI